MNLHDAVEALKSGKKIRLKGWGTKSYLKMEDDISEVNLYSEESHHFDYQSTILLTDDWEVLYNDDNSKYSFTEMIDKLREGKKCRRESWEPYTYIMFDKNNREIIKKRMSIIPFILNFDSFVSNEWEAID